MANSRHFYVGAKNVYYWKHSAQNFPLLETNVYYWKVLATLLEKCLIVAIWGAKKNVYYWKVFAQNFPIVERNGYYWKGGKARGLAG
ncbi:MAG: hypothetical protein ACRENG_24250 [bacterium]